MRALVFACFVASCAAPNDTVVSLDCRRAEAECAPGFLCVATQTGQWTCIPDLNADQDTTEPPQDTQPVTDLGAPPEDLDAPEAVEDISPDVEESPPPDVGPEPDLYTPDTPDTQPVPEDVPPVEEDLFQPEPDVPDVPEVPPVPPALTLVIADEILSGFVQLPVNVQAQRPLVGVEFQVDGITVGTDIIPPYGVSVNTALFKDGPHTVTASTVDTLGLTASDSVGVVFDNTAPSFTSVVPAAGATVFYEDGPFVMTASLADTQSLDKVTFRANGVLLGELSTPPFAATSEWGPLLVSPDALPKGVHVEVSAQDQLGQVTTVTHDVEVHTRGAWVFKTLGEIWSGPVALPDGRVVFGNQDDKVYAVAADGTQSWVWSAGSDVNVSPAVDADHQRIYVGTLTGRLAALGFSGNPLWTLELASPVAASPSVGGDRLAVATFDGNVRLLEGVNGGTVWTHKLPDFLSARPAVTSDGLVLVGCQDHTFYALKDGVLAWAVPTGEQVWSAPVVGPNGAITFGSNDGWIYSVTKSGGPLWAHQLDGQFWGAIVLSSDQAIYAASTDKRLYKLDADDGTTLWNTKLGGFTYAAVAEGPDDTVYIGTTAGVLYGLDAATGEVRMEFPVGGTIHGPPVVVGDRVIVGSTARDLKAVWRWGAGL